MSLLTFMFNTYLQQILKRIFFTIQILFHQKKVINSMLSRNLCSVSQ